MFCFRQGEWVKCSKRDMKSTSGFGEKQMHLHLFKWGEGCDRTRENPEEKQVSLSCIETRRFQKL
jgi:hypothetical protein